MATVSLDSPSCEVTLFDPVSVVYRDATRQAKGLYHLKCVGALWSGLAYLSRYNSSWFCHSWYQSYKVTLEIHFTLKKCFQYKSLTNKMFGKAALDSLRIVLST
jgi:hypothetical protein